MQGGVSTATGEEDLGHFSLRSPCVFPDAGRGHSSIDTSIDYCKEIPINLHKSKKFGVLREVQALFGRLGISQLLSGFLSISRLIVKPSLKSAVLSVVFILRRSAGSLLSVNEEAYEG